MSDWWHPIRDCDRDLPWNQEDCGHEWKRKELESTDPNDETQYFYWHCEWCDETTEESPEEETLLTKPIIATEAN